MDLFQVGRIYLLHNTGNWHEKMMMVMNLWIYIRSLCNHFTMLQQSWKAPEKGLHWYWISTDLTWSFLLISFQVGFLFCWNLQVWLLRSILGWTFSCCCCIFFFFWLKKGIILKQEQQREQATKQKMIFACHRCP